MSIFSYTADIHWDENSVIHIYIYSYSFSLMQLLCCWLTGRDVYFAEQKTPSLWCLFNLFHPLPLWALRSHASLFSLVCFFTSHWKHYHHCLSMLPHCILWCAFVIFNTNKLYLHEILWVIIGTIYLILILIRNTILYISWLTISITSCLLWLTRSTISYLSWLARNPIFYIPCLTDTPYFVSHD